MTSECIIRGLPHFVKPDEDRIAQLRDLEEYIAEGHGQKWIVEIACDELGGCSRRAIRSLGVAMTAAPPASVDLSEIPADRGSEDHRPMVASPGDLPAT